MEKTEMMKRYEKETGKNPICSLTQKDIERRFSYCQNLTINIPSQDYMDMVEAKASAYDRLMSGEPTAKEIANVLNRIIAMDADFKWYAFGVIPYGTTKFRWVAVRGSTKYRVPCFHIKFDGDWKDSLTLPDGWEEK